MRKIHIGDVNGDGAVDLCLVNVLDFSDHGSVNALMWCRLSMRL